MGQAVVCRSLEGVTDGVAVVQYRAQAALQLVFGDHVRLEADGVENERLQHVEVSCSCFRNKAEVIEKVASREETHLDGLGEPVGDLVRGKRTEPSQIGSHKAGPEEGADQVLAFRKVHPDLSPHRAVDHSEQGGRQHDEVYPAHVGPGDEAAEVPDHTAAQREDSTIAGQPLAGELADAVGVNLHGFGRLASWNLDLPRDPPTGIFEGVTQPGGVQRPDGRVGEDHAQARVQNVGDDRAEFEVSPDDDGIRTGDGYLYRTPRHPSTSSTTREGGRPSPSTSKSATSL